MITWSLHYVVLYPRTLDIYQICLLTAIGLPPGGSSTVHIYTQTVHRTTQSTQTIHRTTQLIWEKCGPYPISASYTQGRIKLFGTPRQ